MKLIYDYSQEVAAKETAFIKPVMVSDPGSPSFKAGDKVLVLFDDDVWYAGKVLSVKGSTLNVSYEDGDEGTVNIKKDDIVHANGNKSFNKFKNLKVGDEISFKVDGVLLEGKVAGFFIRKKSTYASVYITDLGKNLPCDLNKKGWKKL